MKYESNFLYKQHKICLECLQCMVSLTINADSISIVNKISVNTFKTM